MLAHDIRTSQNTERRPQVSPDVTDEQQKKTYTFAFPTLSHSANLKFVTRMNINILISIMENFTPMQDWARQTTESPSVTYNAHRIP